MASMYPVTCDEPDQTIKANNLLWIREGTSHLVGLPFSVGVQMCWGDWNLFQPGTSDERREQLERMIGGIRMIGLFDFEQIVYWGF